MWLDEATKQRLVAELRDYLDDLAQVPDDDAKASPAVDLYSLFTELAGLRNEVRLESRQFKGALDEFRGVFATLEASGQRLQGELEAAREKRTAAIVQAERSLLLELITLRDRLGDAHRLAAGYRAGALARLVSRREQRLIHDLAEGLEITLRRSGQILTNHDVAPIAALGEPVDPHVMRVAGVRAEPAQADGVVLEEAQRGYRRAGEMLRLAEVIANKTESSS
jgi:molecular chaperone GrpE